MRELTERQKQIIKETISLVSEGGFKNFSIRKLAERVGVSEPAIYRHFKDKADIMLNAALYIRDNWPEQVRLMVFDDELSGLDRIEKFYRNAGEFLTKNPDIAEAFYYMRTSKEHWHLMGGIHDRSKLALRPIGHIVNKGHEDGSIRNDIPANDTTIIAMASWAWLTEKWHLSGQSFDLMEHWEPIWKALRKMIEATE